MCVIVICYLLGFILSFNGKSEVAILVKRELICEPNLRNYFFPQWKLDCACSSQYRFFVAIRSKQETGGRKYPFTALQPHCLKLSKRVWEINKRTHYFSVPHQQTWQRFLCFTYWIKILASMQGYSFPSSF